MRWLLFVAACGSSTMATPDATPATIDVPAGKWTWVEVPGTTCANGSPAGIGVNRGATAGGPLDIYFEGGGACWDVATCTANPPLAINLDVTYDAAKLATDTAALVPDRSATNPYANATYVFVPYCTADLHAGTQVMAYPGGPTIHHTGGSNTQAFVDAIAAAFPDAPLVWVSGSSAGGYGATLNFHRFTAHWANAHLMEDSSPFVDFVASYPTMQDAWKLAFPPNCTSCATSFTSVFDAVVAAHPDARIGLMTFDNDETIRAYFGYPSLIAPQDDLITKHFNHPNTHVFEVVGTSHTMLGNVGAYTVDGVPLATWLTQWLTGDPAWATVR